MGATPAGRGVGASRISAAVMATIRCPACRAPVAPREAELVCTAEACRASFPVVDGIPVLVDDRRCVFRAADIAAELGARGRSARGPRRLRRLVRAVTPSISKNVRATANFGRLAALLRAQTGSPRVLVLGGGVAGEVIDALLSAPAVGLDVEIVRADIVPDPATMLVCDAQSLPFDDGTFDAVVAQGVFQHVPDPWQSAQEIHRVLNARGLVYAETPFMQQVHEGPHDFHRFTHLGHRRLFRRFEELDSGATGGPGMAVAWAWRHFLWSFAGSRLMGVLLPTFASFTSFFLKAFDRRLIGRPRALDAAASVYFLGRRSETTLSDRELVAGYRGAEVEVASGARAPRPVNEVFSQWAAAGWDAEMARNHAPAVEEMLAAALVARGNAGPFTAVDAGCGNGWVVRRLRARAACRAVTGVDTSAGMIAKARSIDPEGDYRLADLLEWTPPEPVDLVHSMEVLYYLEDPVALLRRIRAEWLRPGGWAVFGVDYYAENPASLAWPAELGVRVTTWSEARWRAALLEAGFTDVRVWRAAAVAGAPGTLAMLARAPAARP
jgi:SAM-dependent methyltransferase